MNKVELIGRLTKDPEVRYTPNNAQVASFTLAVNRRFVQAGQPRQADFIPIVAWSKLGEFCGKYFKKGQQVGIVGRIQTRNWDDDKGQRHYATEVIAEEAYFAEGRRDVEVLSGQDVNFDNPFDNNSNMANNGSEPKSPENKDFTTTSDDDLPF